MRFIVCIIAVTSYAALQAQGGPNVFGPDPCDGLMRNDLTVKLPVAYQYVREANVVWSKQVWREMDLREKQNHVFYFPLQYQPCRFSLIQIINRHILKGDITAFEDESFYKPLTPSRLMQLIRPAEEVVSIVYDEKGNEYPDTLQVTDSLSLLGRVIKVRIKEDWFFDAATSKLEVRISGMAFYSYIEEKEAFRELFWIYFPAARKFLSMYKAFNAANESDLNSFDDLFLKRQFSSRIVKESNVYDREVADYCRGLDAVLESDRIKRSIFTWEHDLWDY
ncbi:MAG: type IX secretion system ring subunit PorN/GldN [Bacteroidia bacterium]